MKPVLLAIILCLAGFSAQAELSDDDRALLARQSYVEGNYPAAVADARPLAEAGVPRAQLLMGYFYEQGLGVPADPAQARGWYEKAAAQGHPQAIHNLARSYEMGELGLPQDKARARALYAQAAALDFAGSLHNLGRMLLRGEGGPVDAALGRALYERAVALGNQDAMADYGYVLATGDGLPADLPRARKLYRAAAAQELDWALRDYAEMLELAEGGPQDLPGAIAAYKESAALGYAMAGFDLAELGRDHPESLTRAETLAWCHWAEAQPPLEDGTDYNGRCAGLLPDVTAAETTAAQERARTIATE